MSENLTNDILDAENNDAIITEENATVDTASEPLDFCPVCGTELDPETGACLKCKQEAEEKNAAKNKKKGMVTMIFGIVFSVLALIAFGFFVLFAISSISLLSADGDFAAQVGGVVGGIFMLIATIISAACELPFGIGGLIFSIVTAVRGKGGIRVTGIILAVLNVLMIATIVVLFIISTVANPGVSG